VSYSCVIESESTDTTTIVGAALGGVLGVTIIIALVVILILAIRNRRNRRNLNLKYVNTCVVISCAMRFNMLGELA